MNLLILMNEQTTPHSYSIVLKSIDSRKVITHSPILVSYDLFIIRGHAEDS